eukprot:SAG22_NODE_6238_length_882_cov_0.878672_3_plen_98_part_00
MYYLPFPISASDKLLTRTRSFRPSDALAKTIQMWRAAVLLAQGVEVSCNMAPPSRTHSVVHSAQAKAAIEGMAWFAPVRANRSNARETCLLALFWHH